MTKRPQDAVPLEQKPPAAKSHLSLLALGALGVVFGDIGTSPLYAFRQCFQDLNSGGVDAEAVVGILSLVFWSLIVVVCLKYVTFIMRADHDGEGGILAMLALLHTKRPNKRMRAPGLMIWVVLFGAALLYGDGVITPAISVLSAVEGLKVATPGMQGFVVPLSVGILLGLFLLQSRGTGQVGNFFGPVMLLWFLAMGTLGVAGIYRTPEILRAINPAEAFGFFVHHGWAAFLTLGGVVLCFSGAEALFADLGHFGRLPIVLAWYGLVLPALLLNYFGQGALLLHQPARLDNPFFALVPHAVLYPMVALATAATVIASQALISGAFSLTEQAIHMGYFPPLAVIHTSKEQRGQIYIRAINYGLMLACIAVVLAFRSSERLGSAYGLAVIGTMTITSLTYLMVLRRVWKWNWAGALSLAGFFLLVDCAFLAGNIVKIFSGAWVPVAVAFVVFAVFWIWINGQVRYHRALQAWSMPIDKFRDHTHAASHRHEGTAVFLTRHSRSVPLVGRNDWLKTHARHEQVLLLTVIEEKVPYVCGDKAIQVEQLASDLWHITAAFGFMQHPDVTHILKAHSCDKLKFDWDRLVCYLPEPRLVSRKGWWRHTTLYIYNFLLRNSLTIDQYFHVPPKEIIHVAICLEV